MKRFLLICFSRSDDDPDRKHVLRTHHHCWCDNEMSAMFGMGVMDAFYVVEIVIKPWDPKDHRNKHLIPVS